MMHIIFFSNSPQFSAMTGIFLFILLGHCGALCAALVYNIPDMCDEQMYSTYLDLVKRQAPQVYAREQPVPHIEIDGMYPPDLLRQVIAEFPDYSDGSSAAAKGWDKSTVHAQNRKLQSNSYMQIGPATKFVIAQMQSMMFIQFLEILTGIDHLIPDYNLNGAGPHQTLHGGHLSIHLDYNYNPHIRMWRRVNVFLYLNEDWEEDWGGHLEFWKDLNTPVKKISPTFNKLVVFTTSEESWHGHPDPLLCPSNRSRKSIALYYYTVDDAYIREKRVTDFRPRKSDNFTLEQAFEPIEVNEL